MARQALVMGIDVGGQTTKLGVVDARGNILYQSVISSLQRELSSYVEDLTTAIKDLIKQSENDGEVKGIGIGAPNGNYYKGTIEFAPNLKWAYDENDKPMVIFFAKMIRDIVGIPVAITNDANAAAIGEMVFGNAKGMKDFVVITLGTGLGSGIVSNGELIYGHDGFAGEYGHIAVDSRVHGRQCGCGRRGCLEAYASATGIKRTAFELMAKMSCDSELRDTPYSKFESVMLSLAADKKDPIALEAFRYTGEILGKALADLMATTSPEAIILFGGLAKAGKYIFEPTKWYMEENMMATFKNKVKLLPSGIEGKNAAILGSSALIWQKQIQ